MSKRIVCVLLCLCAVLCGCVYRSSVDSGESLAVYRLESSEIGTRLVRAKVALAEGEKPLDMVTRVLSDNTGAVPARSAIPAGVSIKAVSCEKGVARVEMSPEYLDLDGTERILAESAIVLSLCGIDEICYVDISCGAIAVKSGLAPEQYSEADGLCGEYERNVKLYLPDDRGTALYPRSVAVLEDSSGSAAERVMQVLLRELDGMESTEIASLSVEEGICSVDLSHEFFGAEPTESYMGMLMIYSLVDSLCRVPGVEKVSLSVEGYALESYGGFRCQWPMSENVSLINY